MRQRQIGGAPCRLLSGLVAIETEDRLVRHLPQQRELVFGQRRSERRDARRKTGADHGDDIDVPFHHHQQRAVVRGEPRRGEVVEIVALVKQRGFRRVQVFRRDILFERTAAECDHSPAQIRDRKHHAITKPIVGNRNVVAAHQQAGFDHVLNGNAVRAEVFFEREAIRRRIADPKLQLHRRRNRAVTEIAAGLGAVARS